MIVAGHQADLLPYSGFWYKMAKADLFDLKIFDHFQPRGYQRRAVMRGRWTSLPVIGSPTDALICDVRILPVQTRDVLTGLIVDRYEDSKYWPKYGPHILNMINEIHTEHLWQFNFQLILGIRELLDIKTPISIARPPVGRGETGLASIMKQYHATTYLSGTGGRAYKGDCEEFHDAGIDIAWSTHQPVTGDSILSVLMDYDDPMAVVMSEQPVRAGNAIREDLPV